MREYAETNTHAHDTQTILAVCASVGLLGFSLIYAELFLIEATSSLTFGICSVAKELMLIALSVAFNGDHLSNGSIFGFSICLCAIYVYKKQKYSQAQANNDQAKDTDDQVAEGTEFELVPNGGSDTDGSRFASDSAGEVEERLLAESQSAAREGGVPRNRSFSSYDSSFNGYPAYEPPPSHHSTGHSPRPGSGPTKKNSGPR